MTVPTITLNDGNTIPQLGFGLWQVEDEQSYDAVTEALRVGYRSIDTAAIYGNEAGTGRALRDSGVPRDELFVTTKLWNSDQGYDSTLRAFDTSLARLGLDYVDLYLIHWPCPQYDTFVQAWHALERVQQRGLARSIGVSNFHQEHLSRLIVESDTVPAVNQIELHPSLPQHELVSFNTNLGIATESWSPLGRSADLDSPTVTALADALGRTPAQVILRWHIQRGLIVFPKSSSRARLAENLDIFDFELDDSAMHALNAMGSGNRVGPDPTQFNRR